MWACIFAPFFSLSRCYSFSYRIEADRILCHRPWSCVSVIFECNNSWRSFFLGSIVALYAVHFILFPILFCCMHSRLHKYRSIMNIETRLELIFTERILLGDLRFSISFNYSISQSVCVCVLLEERQRVLSSYRWLNRIVRCVSHVFDYFDGGKWLFTKFDTFAFTSWALLSFRLSTAFSVTPLEMTLQLLYYRFSSVLRQCNTLHCESRSGLNTQ